MNKRLLTALSSIRHSKKTMKFHSNILHDEITSVRSRLQEEVKFDNLKVRTKLLKSHANLNMLDDVNNYLYVKKVNMHFKLKDNTKFQNNYSTFATSNDNRSAISSHTTKRYRAHFKKKDDESEGFSIQLNLK